MGIQRKPVVEKMGPEMRAETGSHDYDNEFINSSKALVLILLTTVLILLTTVLPHFIEHIQRLSRRS